MHVRNNSASDAEIHLKHFNSFLEQIDDYKQISIWFNLHWQQLHRNY